jgi:hypothetical protein
VKDYSVVKTLSGHSDKVSRVDISPNTYAPIKVLTKREMLELKREERERDEGVRRAEAGFVVKSEPSESEREAQEAMEVEGMAVEESAGTHQLAEVCDLLDHIYFSSYFHFFVFFFFLMFKWFIADFQEVSESNAMEVERRRDSDRVDEELNINPFDGYCAPIR